MTDRPISLLLVDDHAVVRMGLASLFSTVPTVVVVGEAGTGAEALVEARRAKPDVVILDVRLPDANGVDVCRSIRDERPETGVLMLTSYADDDAVISAVMAGAAGYFLKSTDPQRLIEAVERVARGESLLDPSVTSAVLERLRHGAAASNDPLARLTLQERRILTLIAEGRTNREIAATLFLSEHTVKTYVSALLRKLHLARRAEAAAFISRHAS